jgi:rare lipoprotein A
MNIRACIAAILAAPLAACSTTDNNGAEAAALTSPRKVVASVYHEPQRIACGGGRFRPHGVTFAHKTLPCGTKARFRANGRTVVATLNDRGPYVRGRDVDLSLGAANALGLGYSVHKVEMEIVR